MLCTFDLLTISIIPFFCTLPFAFIECLKLDHFQWGYLVVGICAITGILCIFPVVSIFIFTALSRLLAIDKQDSSSFINLFGYVEMHLKNSANGNIHSMYEQVYSTFEKAIFLKKNIVCNTWLVNGRQVTAIFGQYAKIYEPTQFEKLVGKIYRWSYSRKSISYKIMKKPYVKVVIDIKEIAKDEVMLSYVRAALQKRTERQRKPNDKRQLQETIIERRSEHIG